MHVDPLPGPEELPQGAEVPREIQRAVRIAYSASSLVGIVLQGPILKELQKGIHGEGWQETSEVLLPPRLCDEVAAACYRLAEAMDRQRESCMDSHVAEFKSRGGKWPTPAAPVNTTVHRTLESEFAKRIDAARPSSGQSPVFGPANVKALRAVAKGAGLDVEIVEVREDMSVEEKAKAIGRVAARVGLRVVRLEDREKSEE